MSLCSGCHAGCCRSFAVPVTGADILRIEREQGLDVWQFICRWSDPDGAIARRYAPHFFFEDDPQTPYTICLIQRESTLFPGTTRCQFLQETPPDGEHPCGQGSCGIYHHRPAACRVFPTKFDRTESVLLVHDVPTRGRDLSLNPLYQLCPRPWTAEDVDPLQGVQDLVIARYEMQFFHQIAEQWNRKCLPFELFPEFLRLVYSNRVMTADEAAQRDQQRQAA